MSCKNTAVVGLLLIALLAVDAKAQTQGAETMAQARLYQDATGNTDALRILMAQLSEVWDHVRGLRTDKKRTTTHDPRHRKNLENTPATL